MYTTAAAVTGTLHDKAIAVQNMYGYANMQTHLDCLFGNCVLHIDSTN